MRSAIALEIVELRLPPNGLPRRTRLTCPARLAARLKGSRSFYTAMTSNCS